MYDIVIIGAGPAGSTIARLLANEYKILILDKRNLHEQSNFNHHKACGGLISPDAQRMLAKFGLGVPKEVLVDPQLFSVKVIDIDNNMERFYQRNYLNIDREIFDRWLVSLIPGNVKQVYNAMYKNYEFENGVYTISYTINGVIKTVQTKYLVGADGGNSLLRKNLYPNTKIKSYVSIQEWYKQTKTLNYYTAIFDREISDYYSWTISKGDSLLVGTAVEVKEGVHPNVRFEILKKKLISKGMDISNLEHKEGSFIVRPSGINNFYHGKETVFLIGESAGFISPSSAEGYSFAFKSALALSKAFTSENILKKYKQNTRKIRCSLFLKKIKLPAMYNKLFRKIILKTKLLTIKVEDD